MTDGLLWRLLAVAGFTAAAVLAAVAGLVVVTVAAAAVACWCAVDTVRRLLAARGPR